MLAALLCNLERRGPILRKQTFASVNRDVQKAADEIRQLLAPSAIPGALKAKLKRSTERIAEISALPAVSASQVGLALLQTQSAMLSAEQMFTDMQPQPWMIELRMILEQLAIISFSLNDDEEALLLLM